MRMRVLRCNAPVLQQSAICPIQSENFISAPVVKLADTLDLGSNAARRAGSSPVRCIIGESAKVRAFADSSLFLCHMKCHAVTTKYRRMIPFYIEI